MKELKMNGFTDMSQNEMMEVDGGAVRITLSMIIEMLRHPLRLWV